MRELKISFRGRQGWSKDIGHYRKDSDRKIAWRRFWLGHDRSRVIWLASIIDDYHTQFVENDPEGLWTVEHLRAIKFIIDISDGTRAPARLATRAFARFAPSET